MKSCLFCAIARGELPSRRIYEDDELVAFYDIHPMAPIHFLLVPRKHIVNLMSLAEEDAGLMGRLLFRAQALASQLGLDKGGARFIINCGGDGGQTEDHLHIHVLGGRRLRWPPG